MPTNITSQNFKTEVLESGKTVIVDLWAEWCGPCKLLGPTLDKFEQNTQHPVKICKINIDNEPNIGQQYNVRSIPTLILFIDGKERDRKVGNVPLKELEEWVQYWNNSLK